MKAVVQFGQAIPLGPIVEVRCTAKEHIDEARTRFDARVWWQPDGEDDRWVPTRKGISIPVGDFDALLAALLEAREHFAERGLLPPLPEIAATRHALARPARKARILELATYGLRAPDIAKEVGVSQTTVNRDLADLHAKGLLKAAGQKRGIPFDEVI
jgi:hypothetical protein